jgi:hypothetical protein
VFVDSRTSQCIWRKWPTHLPRRGAWFPDGPAMWVRTARRTTLAICPTTALYTACAGTWASLSARPHVSRPRGRSAKLTRNGRPRTVVRRSRSWSPAFTGGWVPPVNPSRRGKSLRRSYRSPEPTLVHLTSLGPASLPSTTSLSDNRNSSQHHPGGSNAPNANPACLGGRVVRGEEDDDGVLLARHGLRLLPADARPRSAGVRRTDLSPRLSGEAGSRYGQ